MFEIKSKHSQLPVIERIYINGGVSSQKKQYATIADKEIAMKLL